MDYNIYKRNPFRFPKMLTPDVPSVSFVFCRIKNGNLIEEKQFSGLHLGNSRP